MWYFKQFNHVQDTCLMNRSLKKKYSKSVSGKQFMKDCFDVGNILS